MIRKERTVRVENWKDLTSFLDRINPYEETIAWSGYINKIDKRGKLKIVALYFTTKPVEILKE